MSDFDINKVISGVINNQIDQILSGAKGALTGAADKLKVRARKGFSLYVTRTYQKCAYIKTILYRDRPVSLTKHYVEPTLSSQGNIVDSKGIVELLSKNRHVAIVGTAGLGKSLLMKSLFMSLVNTGYRKIPIFIELRELNGTDTRSIKDLIF
jgi:hypothetical protein